MLAQIESRWNSLDILVNNAGDLVQRSKVEDFSDDLLDRVVSLNFHLAVYVTRRAIPLLRRGVDPSIINLSLHPNAHNGVAAAYYAATKAASTPSARQRTLPTIRVNALSPGVALTDFHRTHTTPEALETIASNTPLKRLGTAEDHGGGNVLCGERASVYYG